MTIDQDEIREWAEARDGHPAMVRRSRGGRGGGILRIDFPGFSGEGTLEPVSWEEWFDIFEQRKLAFLHDTTPASRFNKLINRGRTRR